jgi:hemerythrin-like metal-binding protein
MKDVVFALYYQPKINLHTKKVESAEALIRIKTKEGKVIPTDEFLSDAKKSGKIVDIDRWVFKKLTEDARYISMMTQEDINISFNVSAQSFLEDDFIQNLQEIFDFTSDFLSLFEIELTQQTLIKDAEKSLQNMNKLKDMGLSIALDDFGVGYSSLAYLKDFPIDSIRLDKTFIDGITKDEKTTKIVHSILYLAQELSLKTVAKGVEETSQVVWLHENGCDEIQGFYYSKALPLKQFVKFAKAVNQRDKKGDYIIWSSKYSIGNIGFDTQHMIIASILNKLYEELHNKGDVVDVSEYFDLLDRYITTHFKAEESYMKKTNYKDIKEHIKLHDEFRDMFKKFKTNLTSSNTSDSIKLFQILKEWFVKHELRDDKKFM